MIQDMEFSLWLVGLRTWHCLCKNAALIPGLAQWVKDLATSCDIGRWCGLDVVVAVAVASSCSSNSTPGPGTSICHRYRCKKKASKKKKNDSGHREGMLHYSENTGAASAFQTACSLPFRSILSLCLIKLLLPKTALCLSTEFFPSGDKNLEIAVPPVTMIPIYITC